MQYLYVPYRDQSNINNYDSSLLQSDYSGLFRDRTYGGLDHIASANQLTTGVTSRVYDDAAVERFNVSVGQSTISASLAPAMTILSGRKITRQVR